MVKFFLRNQKNLPKSNKQRSSDNKDKQQKKKTKKVKDYRLIIWQKMFTLLKIQHQTMVQKMIRKIKQAKQKLEAVGTDQQKKLSILKQIQKLDKKYHSIKEIKKEQLKMITIYIIVEIFKVQNVDKIIQKSKLDKQKIDIKKLKQYFQSQQNIKKFVQKLSMLTSYQTELEKCAQLLDVVQQKKLHRKTKLKQKKTRKYEKEHGIIAQQSKLQDVQQNSDQQDHSHSNQDSNEQQLQLWEKELKKVQQNLNSSKQKLKRLQHNPISKLQLKNIKPQQNAKHNHSNHSHNNNNKKPFQQRKQFKKGNKFDQFKPIHKQRTQFKKTGRNKVKYQKQKKKQKFRNQGKFNQNQQSNQRNNNTKVKIVGGRPNYPIKDAHPSWQAKQDLKKQVFIKPFQGKKIVF